MDFACYLPTTGRPIDDVTADIVRLEDLGYVSAWIADHLFIDNGNGRNAAHDPLIQLAHAAANTSRIGLGTLVLGAPFRPVWQLAREATALADASGGRYILGLGAGWHKPEFDAFGIPFDHLVTRLEEQVAALKPLIAGERVDREDRYQTLQDASVFQSAPPPPLWIAGKGPRMLRLAAREAAGWNLAWGGADPSWCRETLDAFRRELEAAGRAGVTTSLGIGVPYGSTDEEIADMGDAYRKTGIDLLIMVFADHPGAPADPGLPERAAQALGLS